jgi:hypothetical protein
MPRVAITGLHVVSAFGDYAIHFVPFTGKRPDFTFDGSHAETASHRYTVRTIVKSVESEEDGEVEVEVSTLVGIEKSSGTERILFEPPEGFEIGIAAVGNELALRCGNELYFIVRDQQFREIEAWCVEGDADEPLEGCVPVDYEVVAHPRVPLLVISSGPSYYPVKSWLVVRRDGKSHLVGALGSLDYAAHDGELVFESLEPAVIENVDELIARAARAPVIAHPWDDLFSEFRDKLANIVPL